MKSCGIILGGVPKNRILPVLTGNLECDVGRSLHSLAKSQSNLASSKLAIVGVPDNLKDTCAKVQRTKPNSGIADAVELRVNMRKWISQGKFETTSLIISLPTKAHFTRVCRP
jgi:hypothetical protein